MRKFIILPFLIFFTGLIFSQSFSFRPSATLVGEAPFNQYISFKIDMVKSSPSPMTLKWIKLEDTFPSGWDYNLCDHGGCYTGIPDSGTMIPLYDTTSGFLKIQLNPRFVNATATARFYVWDIKYPDQGMETTFEITSTEVTAIQEKNAKETFSFYPNPASDYITVSSVSKQPATVDIISLTGFRIKEFNIEGVSVTRIDISDIPGGIYFVKIKENSGKIITKKLIVK